MLSKFKFGSKWKKYIWENDDFIRYVDYRKERLKLLDEMNPYSR